MMKFRVDRYGKLMEIQVWFISEPIVSFENESWRKLQDTSPLEKEQVIEKENFASCDVLSNLQIFHGSRSSMQKNWACDNPVEEEILASTISNQKNIYQLQQRETLFQKVMNMIRIKDQFNQHAEEGAELCR